MAKLKYSSLIFVSGSEDKCKEYRRILNIPDLKWAKISVKETQHVSMEFLAAEKIREVRPMLPGLPFFVEHSGLIIDSWKGLPGGLTSQFMELVGCDGISKMMQAYKDTERFARGRVVIAFSHPDGSIFTCQGDVTGTIADERRGGMGFGWDPIFIPKDATKTFAEMTGPEKDRYSMRRRAAEIFVKYLEDYFEL